MISINARLGNLAGVHRPVTVYAGSDPDHRAHVGQLVATDQEAAAIAVVLAAANTLADELRQGWEEGALDLDAYQARAFVEALTGPLEDKS